MLKNVYIQNFKCFSDLNIEMSNLNVLAGLNSTGKSSFVQALLLIRGVSLNDMVDDIKGNISHDINDYTKIKGLD